MPKKRNPPKNTVESEEEPTVEQDNVEPAPAAPTHDEENDIEYEEPAVDTTETSNSNEVLTLLSTIMDEIKGLSKRIENIENINNKNSGKKIIEFINKQHKNTTKSTLSNTVKSKNYNI